MRFDRKNWSCYFFSTPAFVRVGVLGKHMVAFEKKLVLYGGNQPMFVDVGCEAPVKAPAGFPLLFAVLMPVAEAI